MFHSLVGKVLLASPFLDDPNFYRTIVLMLQHTEEEAFGLVLNRPTDFELKKVASMVCELECVHDAPLYCGGPVDGPLIAIHRSSKIGGHEFLQGIRVTSDQDDLKAIFEEPDIIFKLFDGFSGWGPSQLESELITGSWLLSDISVDQILDRDDLWESMVKQIGHSILLNGIEPNGAHDPNLN
jgi:putative transcriptional regulator